MRRASKKGADEACMVVNTSSGVISVVRNDGMCIFSHKEVEGEACQVVNLVVLVVRGNEYADVFSSDVGDVTCTVGRDVVLGFRVDGCGGVIVPYGKHMMLRFL